jgi:hypothetical protein
MIIAIRCETDNSGIHELLSNDNVVSEDPVSIFALKLEVADSSQTTAPTY